MRMISSLKPLSWSSTILPMMMQPRDDNNTLVVPLFVSGNGCRVEKTPNIEHRRVFLLASTFWFFCPTPVYNTTQFKKFFKMLIGLFDNIVAKVTANNDFFRQKTDAVVLLGLSSLQKVGSAVRHQPTTCVSLAEHTITSIAWVHWLAWKPWIVSAVPLLKCMEIKHSISQMLLSLDNFSMMGVLLAFQVA